MWQYLPKIKRPGLAFVHRSFTFQGWAVDTAGDRPLILSQKKWLSAMRAFFLHERCVDGGKRGDGGGELLQHFLLVGGGARQVVKIALEFLVIDGFSSRLIKELNTRLSQRECRHGNVDLRAAKIWCSVPQSTCWTIHQLRETRGLS